MTHILPGNDEFQIKISGLPHIGWTVEEVFEEFAQIACDQLQAWLRGELFVT